MSDIATHPEDQWAEKKQALRVLHIGKYFPPYAGGMETYLRDLMVAQNRQGLESNALVHRSGLSLNSIEEYCGAGEKVFKVARAAVWARFLFTPFSPTFPWLLHRLIKRDKPEILHFHLPNLSAFWALLLTRARRIPWVIHWHSDVLASRHSHGLRLFYTLYHPLERALLKRSAKIIASSPPYLDSSEPLAAYRDKCEVVPLGLDPDNLAGVTYSWPEKEENSLRVLAIGRLTYYKGFEYLIRAMAKVEKTELHLVGAGDLDKSLRQMVDSLGVADKITFHGKIPDDALAEQYAACDCLCLPSIERTEAFGMVLLEAMCFNKATIVTDVAGSGMSWVVEDGTSGVVVAAEDIDALANALRQLNGDRARLHSMGEAGRRRFETHFHIDQSSAGVFAVYRKLQG